MVVMEEPSQKRLVGQTEGVQGPEGAELPGRVGIVGEDRPEPVGRAFDPIAPGHPVDQLAAGHPRVPLVGVAVQVDQGLHVELAEIADLGLLRSFQVIL